MRPITPGGGTLEEIERNKQAWEQHFRRRSARKQAVVQRRRGQKITQLEEQLTFRRTGQAPKRILQERQRVRVKRARERSVAFYEELGYPEYAGKYQPFKIPKGKKVTEIQKTGKGLEVIFTSVDKPKKGIAESLLGIRLPSIKLSPTNWFMKPVKPERRPLGYAAGVIASFESPIYSIMRAAGIKTFPVLLATGVEDVTVPRPPPTVSGGLIGKGVGMITGKPSHEFEATMSYGADYATGTIMGDVIASIVGGKIIEKTVVGPAKKLIKPAIAKRQKLAQEWLTHQYMKKGPLAWKGLKEKAVMKLYRTKPYIPPGEVSIPTVETVSRAGKVLPYVTKESLAAEKFAWDLMATPRTAGVMITKAPTTSVATRTLPIYFGLGKELIPFEKAYKQTYGFVKEKPVHPLKWEKTRRVGSFRKIKYWTEETGEFFFRKAKPPPTPKELQKLLPLVTQTQVTRAGIYPYIPSLATKKLPSMLPHLSTVLTGAALAGARIAPSIFEERRKKTKRRTKLFAPPKIKTPTETKIYPVPDVIPVTRRELRETPIATPKPTPETATIEVPTFDWPPPERPFTPSYPSYPSIPSTPKKPFTPFLPRITARRRKKRLGLFDERWFKKQHPLATGKQVEKLLGR